MSERRSDIGPGAGPRPGARGQATQPLDRVAGPPVPRVGVGSGPRRSAGPLPEPLLTAFGGASPCLVTAVVAFVAAMVPLPRLADLPSRLILVVLVQAAGLAATRADEAATRRQLWLTTLGATAVVLPVIAVQTAFSRVPFVSIARGSAAALVWSTLAAALVLVALAGVVCVAAAARPPTAAIVFLPVAVVVPAVLAAGGNLDERAALDALWPAMLVAAAAAGVGTLLPARLQLPIGAAAVGAQFVVLWLTGRGPFVAEDQGRIVPIAAAILLALTALLAVFVPLGAYVVARLRDAGAAADPSVDNAAPGSDAVPIGPLDATGRPRQARRPPPMPRARRSTDR